MYGRARLDDALWPGPERAGPEPLGATAVATLMLWAGVALGPDLTRLAMTGSTESSKAGFGRTTHEPADVSSIATRVGGYLGGSYTYPSTVTITNPPGTDMTVSGFRWRGRPFKSPIYYGLRADRLPEGAGVGMLIDFTHAKAIAVGDDIADFTGTRNGRALEPRAKIDDTFKHLEFSHGHNVLTLNAVHRMIAFGPGLQPYAGIGAGISLPHTEIGFRDENTRTYEYQFAGLAGQVLAGIEVPFGRTSVFFEWKFTYAPYSVPLSHEPYGSLLVTDVWRQFRAWMTAEKPPGGFFSTRLATHHGISGAMIRLGPAAAAR